MLNFCLTVGGEHSKLYTVQDATIDVVVYTKGEFCTTNVELISVIKIN